MPPPPKNALISAPVMMRLLVESGVIKPTPEISRALGALGLNMKDFCDRATKATEAFKPGIPIPLRLTAFPNRTFVFTTRLPPTTYFLKQCSGVEKGSGYPGKEVAGYVNLKQIYEIAKLKLTEEHLTGVTLQMMVPQIIGTAKSMGIKVLNRDGSKNRHI